MNLKWDFYLTTESSVPSRTCYTWHGFVLNEGYVILGGAGVSLFKFLLKYMLNLLHILIVQSSESFFRLIGRT
jgi:hypothetical protein